MEVARGFGLDNRIGAKFLHTGPGFGGSCFPKDIRALIKTAQDQGEPLRLIETVAVVNDTLRAEETASVSTTQSSTTLLRLALGDKIQSKSLSEPFRVPASNFKAVSKSAINHHSSSMPGMLASSGTPNSRAQFRGATISAAPFGM